jgi:hypothetical protein
LGPFFDSLRDVMDIRKSKELYLALREYWWDTTHSFHWSWGETTVTPTDYTAITGLPFTGQAIRMRDRISGGELRALLGFDPLPRRGLGIELNDLEALVLQTFVRYREGDPTISAEQVARSFMWFGLCSTIFANSDTCAYFSLLESLADLDRVNGYSWGEAGLAELYFALDKFSRGAIASLGCFQFPLEVWLNSDSSFSMFI